MPAVAEEERPVCPLCERPNFHPSDHHLVPKSRGGRVTETICRDCHRAIHATFSNKELEREFHTCEALLAHEGLRRMIDFIAKQFNEQYPNRKRAISTVAMLAGAVLLARAVSDESLSDEILTACQEAAIAAIE